MKFVCVLLLAVSAAVSTPLRAQQPVSLPLGIESLGQNAASRTDFTLDHSMLVFASKLDREDDDLRRIIAGVNGVSVHSYRFTNSGMYDAGVLNIVRQQYHAAGWKHMVGKQDKDGGAGSTDLWVRLENNAISNVAVLFAGENRVNFVAVSGSISPLDLLHLGGHFGIPKIEGGIVIPAPEDGR